MLPNILIETNWNATLLKCVFGEMFPVNLLHIFGTPIGKNNTGNLDVD